MTRPFVVRVRELWVRHYMVEAAAGPQDAQKQVYDALMDRSKEDLPAGMTVTQPEFLTVDDPATWSAWDMSMEMQMVVAIDVIEQLMTMAALAGVVPGNTAMRSAVRFIKGMQEYIAPDVLQAAREGKDDVLARWCADIFDVKGQGA